MSDRSIMGFVRDTARRARNIKKLRDPHEIAQYCHKEALDLGLITKEWAIEAQIQAIARMITNRVKRAAKRDTSERQLHLFVNHEDIVFDLRHQDEVVQKALADCNIDDIKQIERQKADNISAAVTEHELFVRAANYILPILEENPFWVWRDAVRYMRDSGSLPDL